MKLMLKYLWQCRNISEPRRDLQIDNAESTLVSLSLGHKNKQVVFSLCYVDICINSA